MKNRIQQYNKVLGIKGKVSQEQLKQLYRIRAKSLHPDRNPSSFSHDQFVLLHEAYEFYDQLLRAGDLRDSAQVFNSKKYPEHYFREKWNVEKRQAARRRAAEKARMKFEYFERKGYYKRLEKMYFILDVMRFILALIFLFIFPVFCFKQEGFLGLILILMIQMITYPLWSKVIKRFIKV